MRRRSGGKVGIAGMAAALAVGLLLLFAGTVMAAPANAPMHPSASTFSMAATHQPDMPADHCAVSDCSDSAAGCPGGQGAPVGWIAAGPALTEDIARPPHGFAGEMTPSGIDRQPALRPPRQAA